MNEVYIQIEFFEPIQVMDKVSQIKETAKRYVALNIFRSSGHREFVRNHLKTGNRKEALREFDDCFRNYGFSDGRYTFNTYCGDGKIRSKDNFEFHVTSNELFTELEAMWIEGKC